MRRTTVGIETVVLLKAIIILLRFIAERKQGAYFWFSASACSQGGISSGTTLTFPLAFPSACIWASGDFYNISFNDDVWAPDITVGEYSQTETRFGGENVRKNHIAIGF